MYSDLKGKTALVTGAGKRTGIGYAIVRALAANGAHVVVADLGLNDADEGQVKTGTQGEMDQIVREITDEFQVEALAVGVDVTDSGAIGRMVEKVKARFDHLDVLCNNAGASFGVPNAVHTYDEAAWMKTIDVNLHSVFRVSRAVLPLMMGEEGKHYQYGFQGRQDAAPVQRGLCGG